jgi:cytochrome b
MNDTTPSSIKVWDAPTRVFHWLLVACCLGAVLSQDSERWRLIHVTMGYSMAGLVVFRVFWGICGTRYARFNNFVRGPGAIHAYLKALLKGHPEPSVGHNPVGALAVIAVLALVVVLTVTGYLTYNDLAGHWTEEVHEMAANLLYGVVVVHVLGVFLSSRMHKENLVRAMFTGKKLAQPGAAIGSTHTLLAFALVVAMIGFWVWQWF